MEPNPETGQLIIDNLGSAVQRKNITEVANLLPQVNQIGLNERNPFILINDMDFGQQVLDLINNRFLKSSDNEKILYINALSGLGARCEALEERTTDFLIENFSKSTKEVQITIALAIKEKLNRATLNLTIRQPLSAGQEKRTRKIVGVLSSIIKSDSDTDVKIAAIDGLGGILTRGFESANLAGELRKCLIDGSPIAPQAFNELSVISMPGDGLIQSKLKGKVSGFDYTGNDIEEKIKLINQIRKFDDGSYKDSLELLSQDPSPLVSQLAREIKS